MVEDDEALRAALHQGLSVNGFAVAGVGTAEAALGRAGARRPDVMVVDVGLPAMSGIELCAELRARHVEAPILILSARDAVGDRVAGLSAGADDYVVKPFDLDELVARLRALIRRASRPAPAATTVITAGSLWIDVDRRLARVGSTGLALSRREFDLLTALTQNAGIVLSRIRLLELVWGYDFDVDTNVVDLFVGYLRRKLAAAGADDVIQTVRGVGFVVRPGGA